jgi:GNAT superfamily N-acetyltransferase
VIRSAELHDAQRIAEITVAAWRASYIGIVPDEVLARQSVGRHFDYWSSPEAFAADMRTWVVASSDVVVGFVHLGPVRPEPGELIEGCELWGIYVDPEYQGQGLGRSLMRAAVEHFRSIGCETAYLWVWRDNLSTRRFYESVGWELDTTVARSKPLPQVRYRLTT